VVTPCRQARPSATAAARPSDRRPRDLEYRSNLARRPHPYHSRRLDPRAPSPTSRHHQRSSRPNPHPNTLHNPHPNTLHNPRPNPRPKPIRAHGDRGALQRHNHHRALADPSPGSKHPMPISKLNHHPMANLELNPNQVRGDRGALPRLNHHRALADPSQACRQLLRGHPHRPHPRVLRPHHHICLPRDLRPGGTPSQGWPRCTLRARLQGLRPEFSRARPPFPLT